MLSLRHRSKCSRGLVQRGWERALPMICRFDPMLMSVVHSRPNRLMNKAVASFYVNRMHAHARGMASHIQHLLQVSQQYEQVCTKCGTDYGASTRQKAW